MPDLDAVEIKGLAIIGVLLLGTFALVIVAAWQASHCIFCHRWLPWRSIKDMECACENRGQCRLAALVRRIRSGEI